MQHVLVVKGWIHPFWYPEPCPSPPELCLFWVEPGGKARGILSLLTALGFMDILGLSRTCIQVQWKILSKKSRYSPSSLNKSALPTAGCKPILGRLGRVGTSLCPSLWNPYGPGDNHFMPKFSSTRNSLSAVRSPVTPLAGWKDLTFFSQLQSANSPSSSKPPAH